MAAGNKFATMLSKRSPRIGVILVYTLLEWLLILLLLINGFFSYLIRSFADYFGLKPPCPWCSRVDHFLKPQNDKGDVFLELLCTKHAKEISKLSYCFNHGRLVESTHLCEDCCLPRIETQETGGSNWGDEEEKRCSCCDSSSFDVDARGDYSKFMLKRGSFGSLWEAIDHNHKWNFQLSTDNKLASYGKRYSDLMDFGDNDAEEDARNNEDEEKARSEEEEIVEMQEDEEETEEKLDLEIVGGSVGNDVAVVSLPDSAGELMTVTFTGGFDYSRVIPVEMIDSVTERNSIYEKVGIKHEVHDDQNSNLDESFQSLCLDHGSSSTEKYSVMDLVTLEKELAVISSSSRELPLRTNFLAEETKDVVELQDHSSNIDLQSVPEIKELVDTQEKSVEIQGELFVDEKPRLDDVSNLALFQGCELINPQTVVCEDLIVLQDPHQEHIEVMDSWDDSRSIKMENAVMDERIPYGETHQERGFVDSVDGKLLIDVENFAHEEQVVAYLQGMDFIGSGQSSLLSKLEDVVDVEQVLPTAYVPLESLKFTHEEQAVESMREMNLMGFEESSLLRKMEDLLDIKPVLPSTSSPDEIFSFIHEEPLVDSLHEINLMGSGESTLLSELEDVVDGKPIGASSSSPNELFQVIHEEPIVDSLQQQMNLMGYEESSLLNKVEDVVDHVKSVPHSTSSPNANFQFMHEEPVDDSLQEMNHLSSEDSKVDDVRPVIPSTSSPDENFEFMHDEPVFDSLQEMNHMSTEESCLLSKAEDGVDVRPVMLSTSSTDEHFQFMHKEPVFDSLQQQMNLMGYEESSLLNKVEDAIDHVKPVPQSTSSPDGSFEFVRGGPVIESLQEINLLDHEGSLLLNNVEDVLEVKPIVHPTSATDESSEFVLEESVVSLQEINLMGNEGSSLLNKELPSTSLPEEYSQETMTSNELQIKDIQDNGDMKESILAEEECGSSVLQSSCMTEKTEDRTIQLPFEMEYEEVEERKSPDTPTDSLHRRLVIDRKEFGTESLDGSVLSDVDVADIAAVEKLKSALKAERKVLTALYAELEEERSAAAISTNQTMAMISRLQEEKAAMQMEALQYQRMMEEQAEYDQEALQLLNELIVKREKEKQELERELETYRNKILRYEAEEKKRFIKNHQQIGRSDMFPASSSGEESDDMSFDHQQEDGFDGINDRIQASGEGLSNNGHKQHIEEFSVLDWSLADFEEERLSIFEQLKSLEERLVMMSSDDQTAPDDHSAPKDECIEEHHGQSEDGDVVLRYEDSSSLDNSTPDGIIGTDKHHAKRAQSSMKPKQLLPLFDAMQNEIENGIHQEEAEQTSIANSVARDIKHAEVVEEVEAVYERLQALEADREFLKHCISSVRKGEKGMVLLQEILQHLRDLRAIDQRARAFNADSFS